MFKIDNNHYSQKISVFLAALWILIQMAGCAGDSYTSKGATRGATTGAVAGAMGGLAKLKQEIGNDSFDGLVALAECRHDVSLSQAARAKQSQNPNFALAGLWLEV